MFTFRGMLSSETENEYLYSRELDKTFREIAENHNAEAQKPLTQYTSEITAATRDNPERPPGTIQTGL